MANDTDRDSESVANKISYLSAVGIVSPELLPIQLDPDLVQAYQAAFNATSPLSTTDVLLIQILRLLRAKQDEPTNNSPTTSVTAGQPGNP
ncbi:MAG: hypothetical protein ACKV2Q_09565 [Planctomycetaceae bacterium]